MPWYVLATELPVEVREHQTRIDIVLRSRKEGGIPTFLVCECKPANPTLHEWCFVRNQEYESCEVLADRLKVRLIAKDAFASAETLWPFDKVFDLALAIKTPSSQG